MFMEGFALLLLGWLPFIWDLAIDVVSRLGVISNESSDFKRELFVTTAFVFMIALHDTVITLPFALYSTFVVEEKHGFNKTVSRLEHAICNATSAEAIVFVPQTIGLFLRDKLVSLLLSLVIGCPVLAVVIFVVRNGGPYFYFYVWAFLCVTSMILMTIYPTFIAPLFNTYTPLKDGELYDRIAELAKKVDFPLTKIFVVDGSKRSAHSNAYFYGFFKACPDYC